MSSFDANLAAFAALAVAVGAVLYARLAAAWRLAQDDGRVRLTQMLARHGAAADHALSMSTYHAMAMRRCMLCPGKQACDQWLASGAQSRIDAFCPNAEFIGRLCRPH
jgi:hypothetical protein